MNIAKPLRYLGVLFGIIILLPPEHPARYSVNDLAFGVGVFSCLPYSRMRSAAVFVGAFSIYCVFLAAFAFAFGLNCTRPLLAEFRTADELMFLAFLLGSFLVLVAQPPCILFLRKQQRPNNPPAAATAGLRLFCMSEVPNPPCQSRIVRRKE
jgi:hypothetical protein